MSARIAPNVSAGTWLTVFSHDTRITLIRYLADGPKTAGELLDLNRATVSHHLALLLRGQLVYQERDQGKWLYKLRGAVVSEAAIEFTHASGVKVVIPREEK